MIDFLGRGDICYPNVSLNEDEERIQTKMSMVMTHKEHDENVALLSCGLDGKSELTGGKGERRRM
jgi:hypothetical protein